MIRWRDPRAPLTAAAATGAAGFAVALLAGGPALLTGAIAGVLAAVLAAVSLVTASTRAAESRSTASGARWMGGGAVVWSAGVVLRPLAENAGLVVSFADLLLLLGTVLTTGGVLIASGRTLPGMVVLRLVTDSYLCAASLFLVGWVVVLRHVYAQADPATFTFTMLPPMISLLVTCAAVPSLARGRTAAWPLLLAGVGVLATTTVAGAADAVARLTDTTPPTWSVMLAPVAFLLLAAAPWALRPRESTPSGPVVGNLLALVPLALVAVATVTLLVHLTSGRQMPPVTGVVLLAGSAVLLLLVRLLVLAAATLRLRRLVTLGDRQLRELAESTGDVVLVCDYEGVVREIGASVEATYGYRPEEIVGGTIFDYIHPEDVPGIQASLRAMGLDDDGAAPGACLIACRVRASDGTWRPTESVATCGVGGEDLLLVTTRDVSDEEALRKQVAHLTFHDGVTGLPNRAYFEERTREVLSGRTGHVAVIFLDLDGFTSVNDSVGHASGDYLLGQAARRLRGAVRPDDTLARWGGDEFAVLVETGGEAQLAVDLAERVLRAVSQEPFRVADRDVALTASVGVAFAEDDMPAGDLIRNADVAMARAKELGGRRVEVFAAQMHADVVRRLELAADLQRALIEHQFAIEYQPVVDLATSRVTAVEALVRWWRGSVFVPPDQFLGPAEDTGLIVPLSEWILRESCREVAAWRASSWDIGLSVNLSARQITAPRFVETVEEALAESGLPASALTLEVIEEMLVEDAEETIRRLSELRALGVRLAIDDFGTGYASLAFLRQLPVDMIKIDPSFVSGLGRDDTLSLLTRTIVRLGHDLGLIVVAEGIERPEQLELLREMGCTRGQGFLVARPMAARGVDSLMRTSLTV
ncbi:putative bifunctional diguanylate cyclase/phosphodiesterase [Nonomuraea lactucae]|uniref:putative bifunctional diguanylate cyclase/phosphodiesterase n=1 Tax=Nonomuraea lactucae TaxID=2249762 RepID=UPI001F05D967|nr:EAL domain-containing protein [Nonomuraea lactucae]